VDGLGRGRCGARFSSPGWGPSRRSPSIQERCVSSCHVLSTRRGKLTAGGLECFWWGSGLIAFIGGGGIQLLNARAVGSSGQMEVVDVGGVREFSKRPCVSGGAGGGASKYLEWGMGRGYHEGRGLTQR